MLKVGSQANSVDKYGPVKLFLSCIGFLWLFLIGSGAGFCADKPADAPQAASEIRITAQRLIFSQNDKFAEFMGNVLATQGNTVIRSDALKVYYKTEAGIPSGDKKSENLIDQIVATGNVAIDSDNRKAYSDKAVYKPESGMLVLTGSKVRIESDGDFINGEQITMNRKTGEITVIGGSENRVEAVFKSGENRRKLNGGSESGGKSGP